MNATVTSQGAILLGRNVVCDAHASRAMRIISHVHSDHLLGLNESICHACRVVATPATRELLGVLRGRIGQHITPLDYGKTLDFKGERITLYDAGHIIGSAQVLVEDEEGDRILYTGDFKLPRAEIVPARIVVMEATYGNPHHRRLFKDQVEERLAELVLEALESGPVYIFGYHGKLQEALALLKTIDVDVPVILPDRVYQVASVCKRHGMELGEYFLSTSDEGRRCRSDRHIGLYHLGSSRYVGWGATRIKLSGWEFQTPCRRVSDREYVVALSDHSDFDQLLEYVAQSRPDLVITDNYRSCEARTLAGEIKKRLGVQATSMP